MSNVIIEKYIYVMEYRWVYYSFCNRFGVCSNAFRVPSQESPVVQNPFRCPEAYRRGKTEGISPKAAGDGLFRRGRDSAVEHDQLKAPMKQIIWHIGVPRRLPRDTGIARAEEKHEDKR